MKFKAKVRKVGNSYVLTIPKAYVKNGDLFDKSIYKVEISEVE